MQTKTTWTIALGAFAFLALALSDYRLHAGNKRIQTEVNERLDELESTAAQPPPEASEDPRELAKLERTIEDLQHALARLEGARVPVEASRAKPKEAVARPEPPPSAPAADDASERFELEQLLAKVVRSDWDYSKSTDEMERFYELARKSTLIEDKIEELEARVASYPDDVQARMELSDFYVGKLMTVSGPEQGLWGAKAETQWKEVVTLDESNWRAHSSLGTNYSFYPGVMGKADDAIHHLERAKDIQVEGGPEPQHVRTFLFLSRMYARKGRHEDARAILEEGLRLHAGDESLTQALAKLDG